MGFKLNPLTGQFDLTGSSSGITELTGEVTAGPGTGSQVATITNGSITNDKVNASAGIVYSKLSLSNSIVNSDISSSAAIDYSKLAALTASRVLVSNGSGVVSVSTITPTELGYLSGASSNIQTQLNTLSSTISNFEWQPSVLTAGTLTPPGSPSNGNRYLINGTGAGGWSGQDNKIAEWNGSSWVYTTPSTGMFVAADDESDKLYLYGGSSWTAKVFELTTASTGLTKVGYDIRIASGGIIDSYINASAGIDASKIANGLVSNTEFQYLDGVTSAIQTQLGGKASTTLNNLGTTSINASLLFDTDDTYNIGGTGKAVNTIFAKWLRNTSNQLAVRLDTFALRDSSNVDSVFFSVRNLLDSGGAVAVDWSNATNTVLHKNVNPNTASAQNMGGPSLRWGTIYATTANLNTGLTFPQGANSVTLAPPTLAGTYTMYLPTNQGAANTYLKNDGSGSLSWSASMGIGNSVTSGTSGSVLFINSSGNLAQDNGNFFWDATNTKLRVGQTFVSSSTKFSVDDSNSAAGTSVGITKTVTSPTGSLNPLNIVSSATAGSVNSNTIYGVRVSSTRSTNMDGLVIGGDFTARAGNTTASTNDAIGLTAFAFGTGTGSSNWLKAISARTDVYSATAVSQAAGLYVENPSISVGTINTAYGLYIESLSGASNNYSIYTGSAQSRFGGNVIIASQNSLELQDTSGGDYVRIRANGTTTSHTLTLPATQGGSNTYLKNDGSGNLSWSSVTPSNDIIETSFTAADNQVTPANVTGLAFSNASVRSFVAQVSIVRGSTYRVARLEGVQRAADWVMSETGTGDSVGITFTITTAGQVQYTSTSTGDTATVKFRATTTSV
jgi:hypothetical protein